MSNFKIGEKVVCVNNSNIQIDELELRIGCRIPIEKEIYTIRQIIYDDGDCFMLEEIINPKLEYDRGMGEMYFYATRFRKLDHAFGEKICAEILESVKVKQEQLN